MRFSARLIGITLGFAVGMAAAQAMAAKSVNVRGSITSLQGDTLTVKTDEGATSLKVGAKAHISAVKNIAMSAIKPGSYIGTAAVPATKDNLRALEVMVFPASLKGVGEGAHPWDLKPKSNMINGTVGKITAAPNGRTLAVSYKTGTRDITVPDGVPIVTIAPADRSDLKPGAAVFILATQGTDGTLNANFISVEKNGVVPPM